MPTSTSLSSAKKKNKTKKQPVENRDILVPPKKWKKKHPNPSPDGGGTAVGGDSKKDKAVAMASGVADGTTSGCEEVKTTLLGNQNNKYSSSSLYNSSNDGNNNNDDDDDEVEEDDGVSPIGSPEVDPDARKDSDSPEPFDLGTSAGYINQEVAVQAAAMASEFRDKITPLRHDSFGKSAFQDLFSNMNNNGTNISPFDPVPFAANTATIHARSDATATTTATPANAASGSAFFSHPSAAAEINPRLLPPSYSNNSDSNNQYTYDFFSNFKNANHNRGGSGGGDSFRRLDSDNDNNNNNDYDEESGSFQRKPNSQGNNVRMSFSEKSSLISKSGDDEDEDDDGQLTYATDGLASTVMEKIEAVSEIAEQAWTNLEEFKENMVEEYQETSHYDWREFFKGGYVCF